MEIKINFQDLVIYLIPGAITVLVGYWFVLAFVSPSLGVDIVSWGALAILLILSYAIGNVVQALGNGLEAYYERRWGGKYSDLLLRNQGSDLSDALRTELVQRIQTVFKVVVPVGPYEDTPQGRRQRKAEARARHEAFHLCYSLILQEDAAQHAEIFQGLYGLYRGLLTAAALGMVASLAIAAKQLVLHALQANAIALPSGAFYRIDSTQLITAVLLLVGFLCVWPLLAQRLKRFARHYATAVYESFYGWYEKHTLPWSGFIIDV